MIGTTINNIKSKYKIKEETSELSLIIVYFFAFISNIILFINYAPVISNDSSSYIYAIESFLSGKLDLQRTPVYPALIYICNLFFGSQYMLQTVCLFQYLIFFISIKYFFKTASYFIKSNLIIFLTTLLYACHPSISIYSANILTESLAVSLTIILVYTQLKISKQPSVKYVVFGVILMLILIFLRPAMLFILPVIFLYNLYLYITSKNKIYILFLTGTLLISSAQIGYCSIFKQQHGIFSPGYISLLNKYYMLRELSLLDIPSDNTTLLAQDIRRNNAKEVPKENYYADFFLLVDKYPLSDINEILRKQTSDNLSVYILAIGKRFFVSSLSRVGFWHYPSEGFLDKLLYTIFMKLPLIVGFIYIFLILYLFKMISIYKRDKTIDMRDLFLWGFICSNIILMIIGAQDEWNRLILPVLPFIGSSKILGC